MRAPTRRIPFANVKIGERFVYRDEWYQAEHSSALRSKAGHRLIDPKDPESAVVFDRCAIFLPATEWVLVQGFGPDYSGTFLIVFKASVHARHRTEYTWCVKRTMLVPSGLLRRSESGIECKDRKGMPFFLSNALISGVYSLRGKRL